MEYRIVSYTDWPYPDTPTSTRRPDPIMLGRPGFPVPGPVWPFWPAQPWGWKGTTLAPLFPRGRRT